jgi:tetratricopeptide (TPR) repeat protein
MDSTPAGTAPSDDLAAAPRLPRDAGEPKEGGASGSRLLGEFLRTLRGSRSLQVIEDLSKTPPLEGRIRPVDVSTLSKIETGKQFPSLTTLLSLEQIYEVPIQRFLDHVKLEKYWSLRPVGGDHPSALAAGIAALDEADYPKAYASFLLAESLAPDREAQVTAAINKSGALWKMGMLQEAINEYCEVLADLSVPPELQIRALSNLASVHRARGNLFEARLHAHEGLRMAEALGVERSQAFFHLILGTLHDDLYERSAKPEERVLREGLRHYEKSLAGFEKLALAAEGAITRVNIGSVFCRLGNYIVGLKHLKDGLAQCEKSGHRRNVAFALKELGRAYVVTRNWQRAKDYLFDAERIAERQGYVDILFMCNYHLREIELANGGGGAHETKRLMRLRSQQEGTFFELLQFEKQIAQLREAAG